MGYDVTPKNGGEDFRANISAWGHIMDAIRETELLSVKVASHMGINDGGGVSDDPVLCNRLATVIDSIADEDRIPYLQAHPHVVEDRQKEVMRKILHEFATFLRGCGGGFEVW